MNNNQILKSVEDLSFEDLIGNYEEIFGSDEDGWLTNCAEEDYHEIAAKIGKPVRQGPPKGTERYSVGELKTRGLVGIYEK